MEIHIFFWVSVDFLVTFQQNQDTNRKQSTDIDTGFRWEKQQHWKKNKKKKNSDSVVSNNNTSIIYDVPVLPASANAINRMRSDSSRRCWCWRGLTIAWRFTSALLRTCGSFIREPSLSSEAGGEQRVPRGELCCRFQVINARGPKSPTDIIDIV